MKNQGNQAIYNFFLPKNKEVRFRKLRWTIMIHLQEIKMCKWRAIFKYYYKPSYRKDINRLRDILSAKPLTGRKSTLFLKDIMSSHEINYPKWVKKLRRRFLEGEKPSRIKVFFYGGVWLVVDGNHRLDAMKSTFHPLMVVDVLILEYKDE